MSTLPLEQKLLNDRSWWLGVADHVAEQATMDSQSRYALTKAHEKLATIDQVLLRIRIGTFGRCDECGGTIEPERLELLVDSDCHVCAKCAITLNSRKTHQPAYGHARPSSGRLNAVPEMA